MLPRVFVALLVSLPVSVFAQPIDALSGLRHVDAQSGMLHTARPSLAPMDSSLASLRSSSQHQSSQTDTDDHDDSFWWEDRPDIEVVTVDGAKQSLFTFESDVAARSDYMDLHKAWGILPSLLESYAEYSLPLSFLEDSARDPDLLSDSRIIEVRGPSGDLQTIHTPSLELQTELSVNSQFGSLFNRHDFDISVLNPGPSTYRFFSLDPRTEFHGEVVYSPNLDEFVRQRLECQLEKQCLPGDAFRVETLTPRGLKHRVRITEPCGTLIEAGTYGIEVDETHEGPVFSCSDW